ncbi:MAG: hypothetical protein RSG77_22575, partial [Hafnia sp.]
GCENERWFSRSAMSVHQGHLMWRDGAFDETTYEVYAAHEIQRYHMDFNPRYKCPGFIHRMDNRAQKRLHLEALRKALSTGDFDVVLVARDEAQRRVWEWY